MNQEPEKELQIDSESHEELETEELDDVVGGARRLGQGDFRNKYRTVEGGDARGSIARRGERDIADRDFSSFRLNDNIQR